MVYIKSKLWNALIGNTKSFSSSTGQSDPNYLKKPMIIWNLSGVLEIPFKESFYRRLTIKGGGAFL